MSDALFYYPNKDAHRPNKCGVGDEAKALIEFEECKFSVDENQVILFGFAKVIEGKCLVKPQGADRWQEHEFSDYELMQFSFPLQDFKEGDRQKKKTLFSEAVGLWMKCHLDPEKTYTLCISFGTSMSNNLQMIIDKVAEIKPDDPLGQVLLNNIFPVFPTEVADPKKLNFDADLTAKSGNFKKWNNGGQNEKDRLGDRQNFLKSLLYPDMEEKETKNLGIKEMAKAIRSLEEDEISIINLLMGGEK